MAFRKLQQIVRSTIRSSNPIGFAKSSDILTPVKLMNPNAEVPALRLFLRHIHKEAFLSTKADCVYHLRMPLNNINQVPASSKYIKSKLPEELSRNVVRLTCSSTAKGGKCDVYVVGTCHVLEESAIQVKAIINHLKPQVVFLELCDERADVITADQLTPQDCKVTLDEIFKFDNLSHLIGCYLYGVFAKKLNIVPGSEFRVAYQEARKYGAKVILGDRPIHITEKRGWGRISLFDKTKWCFLFFQKLLFSLSTPELTRDILKEMLEGDDDEDDWEMKFPALCKVDDERDQYMSWGLLKVASRHSSVVAVVGKYHLKGIQKYWEKPLVIEDLLKLP